MLFTLSYAITHSVQGRKAVILLMAFLCASHFYSGSPERHFSEWRVFSVLKLMLVFFISRTHKSLPAFHWNPFPSVEPTQALQWWLAGGIAYIELRVMKWTHDHRLYFSPSRQHLKCQHWWLIQKRGIIWGKRCRSGSCFIIRLNPLENKYRQKTFKCNYLKSLWIRALAAKLLKYSVNVKCIFVILPRF